MKILVTANTVPFMTGGAEYHIQGLISQLQQHGYQVEVIRFPFWFNPEEDIVRLMRHCRELNLNQPNGIKIDKLISLQFPTYGVQHDDHRVWLMHQHRSVYELFDEHTASVEQQQFRQQVIAFDNQVLGNIPKRFANSQRVAQRLLQYNQLTSTPLYHPPYGAEHFYNDHQKDYIFCPSRLETLKRQSLLIDAARYLTTPVNIIIAGEGGQKQAYQSLIEQYQLQDRVKLIGYITEKEKLAFYASALAVFFAPFDEDYGYITLESMLSAKPVITCTDSGGPLEFIEHKANGYVLEADPRAIAAVIDELYRHPQRARDMGQYGRQTYMAKEIAWDKVVHHLLA